MQANVERNPDKSRLEKFGVLSWDIGEKEPVRVSALEAWTDQCPDTYTTGGGEPGENIRVARKTTYAEERCPV